MNASIILSYFLIILILFTGIFYILNFIVKDNFLISSISSYCSVLIIIFLFRAFLYEPFQIPSGSMLPTLLPGDFVLVKKFIYNIKNPITQKTWLKTFLPKRGDVAVFQYPKDKNIFYIKRIIGIPGDLIIYDFDNKKIKIYPNCNNKKISQCISKKNLVYYSHKIPKSFLNKKDDYFYNLIIGNKMKLLLRNEKIDKIYHDILLTNKLIESIDNPYYQQDNLPKKHWIIPSKSYFAVGDNRDNSLDSRYWGFISEDDLIGKAVFIWMSIDYNQNIWNYKLIRFNRMGRII